MTASSSNKAKPVASVSLDLDNQWSYMKTHGDSGWESFPSYFEKVLPVIFDLLDQIGLRITCFVVGQDAVLDQNRDQLSEITVRGHEVGNHSFSHEQWFHLYSPEEVEAEIKRAHEAIRSVTGEGPIGFRGPGFSWSPSLLRLLSQLEYKFDATTFPTYIGPLGRAYYFWTANLSEEEKEERKQLFGSFKEGRRPVKPYLWRMEGSDSLLEIPVTTIPIIKTPWHLSYLIYLSRFSISLMRLYLNVALMLCKLTKTEPSFLLHPLDFTGGDEVSELEFFPGMDLAGSRKREVARSVLERLQERYTILTMGAHADSILSRGGLPVVEVA